MIYYVGTTENIIKSELYVNSNIDKLKEWLLDQDCVALDTETEGMFNHAKRIVMLQLSNGKDAWVIDTRNNNYIKQLKSYLENITIIGHNLKFDYKFLKLEGIVLRSIKDTFLAECILTNGLKDRGLSLNDVCIKYTNHSLDKTVRNQFVNLMGNTYTDKQILYGAEDVLYLHKIIETQERLLLEKDLISVFNLECQTCLALADIEYNGMKLDINKWIQLATNVESKIPEYEAELDNMVKNTPSLSKYIKKYIQANLFIDLEEGFNNERDINIKWSSPAQVLKVFRDMGLDIKTSSEKEIAKYQKDYPLIKRFIDYKKDCKLATTYGKNFIKFVNKNSGRVHGDFWQILDTHRVSCGGSKGNGKSSVNLQNLPAKNEYLNCFIAEKGWKFIGIDYAAQEARLAACGSKDELWLKTFIEGKDLHSEVCKLMFNINDDLVRTKPDFLRGKTYRDAAKTINFGVLFGMSEFKLSNSLSITIEEAKDLIKKYFDATKQLKNYLDSCAAYGIKNGYIRSFKPYSCIRYFPDWKPELDKFKDFKLIGEITRASYNTP